MSFTYFFETVDQDEVYFSYGFPYTFSKLHSFLKTIRNDPVKMSFYHETTLCKELSGVDVPLLTITTRAN